MSGGQHLVLGLSGPELTAADAALFREVEPAGCILFTRNIVSASQVRKLTDDLRGLRGDEFLIAIDNEGGRVWRTSPLGPAPPSAEQFRARPDPKLIMQAGWQAGRQLRLLGINFNLAPVLDLDLQPGVANALRGRCWGDAAQEVIDRAGTFNRYQRKQGVLGCGKHFPGLGRATVDSHFELPEVGGTFDSLLREEVLPFTALAPELDGILLSHVHFPEIDSDQPGLPSSLSFRLVQQFLRNQLGYEGLVLTDDLDMGAIQKRYGTPEAARLAVTAGVDLVLVCHEPETAREAKAGLESLPARYRDDTERRLRKARKRLRPPLPFSEATLAEVNEDLAALRREVIGTEDAGPADSANSPVEDY